MEQLNCSHRLLCEFREIKLSILGEPLRHMEFTVAHVIMYGAVIDNYL